MTTEERVQRLERQLIQANRRLRVLYGLAAIFAIGSVGYVSLSPLSAEAGDHANAEREVRAARFVLEDKDGKTRGTFSIVDGDPVFALSDRKGKGRLSLTLKDENPRIELYDSNEHALILMGVTVDGAQLQLSDFKGQARVVQGTSKETAMLGLTNGPSGASATLRDDKAGAFFSLNQSEGAAVGLAVSRNHNGLMLSDHKGTPLGGFLYSQGHCLLSIYGESGTSRAMMNEDGVCFKDKKGQMRALIVLGESGPQLSLNDERGKPRTLMFYNEGHPGLSISSPEGKIQWSVP